MAIPAHRISTATSIDVLACKARADVAEHGAAVRIGGRRQARQLRRLQAALRVDGYQAQYFTDGANWHGLEVGPVGPPPRVISWWGAAG